MGEFHSEFAKVSDSWHQVTLL